jgi:hypothetical protein
MTTTIRIDQTSRGAVIANNGFLRGIRIITSPPASVVGHYPEYLLSLVDTSWGNVPRALFHCDIATSGYSPSAYFSRELMTNGGTPFGNLTVAQCPTGASFDIDVD